jgi:MFS family permease
MPSCQSKLAANKEEDSRNKRQLTKKEKDKLFRNLQYVLVGMITSFSVLLPQNSAILQRVLVDYSSSEIGILLSRLASLGSLVEFIINPVLGRLGDSVGRKSIMLLGFCVSFVLRLLATINQSSFFFVAMNLAVSRSFDTVIFTTIRASVSDLYSGEDMAAAMPRLGIAAGLSVILGPLLSVVLKRVTGSTSVALVLSTILTGLNIINVKQCFKETLRDRIPFSWKAASPFGFIKMLSKSKTMFKLMMTSWMQTHTDGRNIVDTQFAFQRDQIGWTADQSGTFVGVAGLKILFGGIIGKFVLVPRLGIRHIGTFSNMMNALGGISFALLPKWQFLILFISAFGDRKRDGIEAMVNSLGLKYGYGKGETMAQLFNLRSTANVLAPFLYSLAYEYGISIGKPSTLAWTIVTFAISSELLFQTLSKEEINSAITDAVKKEDDSLDKNSKYKVGDAVYGKAIGSSKFYKCKIERRYRGNKEGEVFYDVIFDDGENGKKMKDKQIKLKM